MSVPSRSTASRDRVRAHREQLRAQGLRPIQIWVPDTRSATFTRDAHLQSLAVALSARAAEDQEFIEAVSQVRRG